MAAQNEDISVSADSIRWISCRGGNSGEKLTFEDATIAGWAGEF
jgi:hypothetical protein